MPAEILRYYVLKARPEKLLSFDPGITLYNLIDEFAKVEAAISAGEDSDFKQAYEVATSVGGEQTIAAVPFSHLVSVYQAAQGNVEGTKHLLERTGYGKVVKEQWDVLVREFEFVQNWLDKHAPESVKFEVQKSLPEVELSEEQRRFLAQVANVIEKAGELDGEAMHQILYDAKGDLKPGQAFQAIYRVILGKDSGPKAGWFLASLDKDWLVRRLKLEA
jgi:lysyl-tRNA synthetase class 1